MTTKHWRPTRILACGFLGIILIGALLLSLPAASRDHHSIPFLNAIFTSTSATCVTGLVVYDTWTQFTFFGQAVILVLIQIGGLGFMTAVMAILLLTHRRIGLKERSVVAESIGVTRLSGIVRLSRRIIGGTILFEGLGAFMLAIRFIPRFGWSRGFWYALFHSVSAFCNAGFDLLGCLNPGSSLTAFRNDPVVILTIALLIIVGGIGFIVWSNLMDCRKHMAQVGLHTRVALISTACLLLSGMVLFFFTEANGAFGGMQAGERMLNAFFLSVTPRTAGFNTVDTASISNAGKALTIILMWIGAAPGGTGGGIKVTTFVVVLLAAIASHRSRPDISVWHFRLDEKQVRRAFCAMATYCGLAVLGTFLLCLEGIGLVDALFECFSAIGTVGLSTGITAQMGVPAKIIIILLMYAGRVGSLTIFLAVGHKISSTHLSNPVGKIFVG